LKRKNNGFFFGKNSRKNKERKTTEETESKPSIFAINHWSVEISTHWPNLANAFLIWRVHFEATS
jgi:hypothetical protein